MSRQIQGAAPGVIRTFVPRSFDNHHDPEPIEVDIRHPTEAEKRESRRRNTAAIEIDAKTGKAVETGNGNIRIEYEADAGKGPNKRAFERFIVAVRGYTAADGKPIHNGARLFEHGESEIVSEVAAELEALWSLSEEQKKTFAEPSDSSPAETPAFRGTAGTAELGDSIKQDAAA